MLLCHSLWAQSEDLVSEYDDCIPVVRKIPICWPTVDNVKYSIWPEGTQVGDYVADGNF